MAAQALRRASGAAAVRVRDLRQIAADAAPPLRYSEPDTVIEPDVAADPARPSWLVAAFQESRFRDGGAADAGFATSHDAGRHWRHGNLPRLTHVVDGFYWRASDAAVAFGPEHAAYANTIAFFNYFCKSAVAVQRSADGGLHWSAPAYPQRDTSCRVFNDKNWIAVDTNRSSPHYGRIYAVWSRFFLPSGCQSASCLRAPTVLRYSDSNGRRWSRLIDVSGAKSQTDGAIPVVQPDGTLTIVYPLFTATGAHVLARTSHDGGASWSSSVLVGDDLASEPRDLRTGGGLPAVTVDPVSGDLYAAWQDTRLRHDGRNDILLWRSRDGHHWQPLGRVNPASRLDHLTPGIGAYADTISVEYLTLGANRRRAQERFISSPDGGETFTGERILSTIDLRYAARVFGNKVRFLGDYTAIAATPRAAHPVWTRSLRPPGGGHRLHQTLWSANVRLAAP